MTADTLSPEERAALLAKVGQERILVLDGAMGTTLQRTPLGEKEFRGRRFANSARDLKGNMDVLNLTQPEAVVAVHRAFLEAGADILGTNTFSSTRIAQGDYGLEDFAFEMNEAGARLARGAADAATRTDPSKPRFVAGAMGPTNRTASISPDVNRPEFRNVDFDELRTAYREQAEGLLAGGVDILLVETVFDTLNAKAALYAIDELKAETGSTVPVMVSGTITDLSGRNLSGQTVGAFWNSVRHAGLFSIGLNCSFGAKELRAYVAELARDADTRICAYPNAGLPNELGEYDEPPEETAAQIGEWARAGLLNVVGGCCGTTPDHIRAIAKAVEDVAPRKLPEIGIALRLAGLEPFQGAA